MSCSAATACTALGQASGTTLVYRWDGSKWSSQTIAIPTGATSTELNGVSCTGLSACTGVGNWHEVRCNNGQPSCNCFKSPGCTFRAGTLVEQWNGSAWSVQSTLNPDGNERYVDLYDVSCTATGCTAVGDVLNGTLAEQSDGTNWTVEGHPWPKRGRQPVERVVHGSRRVRGRRDWQWRDARRGVERHQFGDSGHHRSAGTGEPQPLRRILPDE